MEHNQSKFGIYILCLLLFFSGNIFSQNIPSNRLTDWTKSGLNSVIEEPINQVNFLVAGGKNDGTSYNDSLISQLLTMAPITIYFPNGSYNFSQTINLPSNVVLRGESADSTFLNFDMLANANLINLSGTLNANTFLLSGDGLCGRNDFTINQTPGIQIGDLLKVVDNDSDLITSSWAYHSTGQIVEVDSIIGNRIRINTNLRRTFRISKQALLQKITPVKNVVIENLTINCEKATPNQTSNIYLNYASNILIKCLKSFNCNFAHIDVRNSAHIQIEGCYFKNGWDYGSGGKAYGIALHHSTSDCELTHNDFNHLRHSVLLQAGANGNVISYNYSIHPYWTDVALPSNSAGDLVLHGNWPYRNLFEGNIVQNIVIDNSHGKNGPNNIFLRNRAELFGIFMNSSPASDSLVFIGNETTASGFFYGNISLSGNGHFCYGNNRKGSVLPSGTGNPSINTLYLLSTPNYYQDTWPLIGPPLALNKNDNDAKKQFLSGYLTPCANNASAGEEEQKKIINLKLYPNPVKNVLYLEGDFSEMIDIQIFDISGEIRLSEKVNKKINLSNLPPGIYFIRIKVSDSLDYVVRKIVKQ